jgi:hypothetical protein
MKFKGRQSLRQVQLKDGFYIEVCNKGNTRGIKIWNKSKEAMDEAAEWNSTGKDVFTLGEFKDGSPVKSDTLLKLNSGSHN